MAFGAVGLAAALPIGDHFELSAPEALIGCSLAGFVLGYVLSTFLDVFLTNTTNSEN